MRAKPCSFCGAESDGMHFEIFGWEERRARGGANRIIQRRRTGRVACVECFRKIRDGVGLAQETLPLW